jgi:hypothetical protein
MRMRSCRAEHADVPAAPYRRYLATGQLILVLASVALFGCRDISEPIAPPETRIKPGRPSYDVYGCSLGAAICAKIDSAIGLLETDDNSYCRATGTQARSRFVSNSASFGFSQGAETPNTLAIVEPMIMNTNPSDYVAHGVTQLNISQICKRSDMTW